MAEITVTMDGTQVSGPEGMTILELAQENGIEIPTLCYIPDLPPVGVCRICVVEVEGSRTLVGSCHTPIARGMVIHTHSTKVIETRKVIVELLMASHCGSCFMCEKANVCEFRRIAAWLKSQNYGVNRKRVRRLMRVMGLKALYRRPSTSKPAPGHKIYPYLLGGIKITQPNQVWAADITYIPMARGFLYLVAIIDWYSRYVLSWRLSNTLDADFCVEALEEALKKDRPEIFNTDQGAQFTGEAFTGLLKQHGVKISMDGKGSYNDNLFVERPWRSVKYEEVYLKAYQDGRDARIGLGNYFPLLQHRTPPPGFRLPDTGRGIHRNPGRSY